MSENYQGRVKIFKRDLENHGNFEELFEHLPQVCFFVKDLGYKLIMCNNATLQLLNVAEKHQIIGKSEYDFFPKKMADRVHQDDVMVMEKLTPIYNKMELIVDENKVVKWVLTTKLPLLKRDSTIGGLMGTTRVLEHVEMIPSSFKRHAKALEYIRKNFNKSISVRELSVMCNLSESYFRKTFTTKFQMSPLQFIAKMRVQIACKQLTDTTKDIAAIAHECGFCDQSYFTNQFRVQIGMTPLKYRILYTRQK